MYRQLIRLLTAVVFVISLTANGATAGRAASITVHFDRDLYIVNGPGDEISARILIDTDPIREGDQPISEGLFSYAVTMSFSPTKADVDSLGDVLIPPELDFFGFGDPAFLEAVPAGKVGVHTNVDPFNNPLLGYNDTLLAVVTLTNLASAVDSYPLLLEFNRDLGLNEDFFVDMNGTTLDSEIVFVPSRVLVIPEPSTAALLIISLMILFCWQFFNRQFLNIKPSQSLANLPRAEGYPRSVQR